MAEGPGTAALPRDLLETEPEYNRLTRPGEAPLATAFLVVCLVARFIGMVGMVGMVVNVVLDWIGFYNWWKLL